MADITRSFLTRPQLELYKREAMWGQDGFVSIYVPEGHRYRYRFGTGETLEKRNTFTINANINELYNYISRFQDIARYRFW